MTWNVNGFTDTNKDLRINILNSINADIIVINETHLGPADTLFIDGYKWISHPRLTKHVNLNRYFGGVGVLINETFLNNFNVKGN